MVDPPATTWRNWAGNQRARPRRWLAPRSAEEVAEAVRAAARDGLTVRMAGTGHSFTGAALTDGVLLLPHRLTGILAVDPAAGLVTAAAGTPLRELNAELDRHGLALANMGDIMEQTLAGAIQTGTHGSGRDAGGLADQVTALELVRADGEPVRCSAGDPDRSLFDAARVGLGALGVLTAVTFRVRPAFTLEAVEAPMPFDEVLDRLDDLVRDNEHLDLYWFPHTGTCATKRNNTIEGPARPRGRVRDWLDDRFLPNTVFDATCRLGVRVPAAIPPVNRLAARLMAASTYSDTSYRVFTSTRRVRFVEQEYAIPRADLAGALREVRAMIERSGWRISFPIEVRVAPPSDAWLSTSYGRDTGYLACHLYHRASAPEYFPAVEAIMTALGGRPHWGKLHTRDAEYLRTVYPRFSDFLRIRDSLDPDRRFGNRYLSQVLDIGEYPR